MATITFLLPGSGCRPVGGYKVVYEYANRLARRGHRITVVHPASLSFDRPLKDQLKTLRYFGWRANGGYSPNRWFNIDSEVRLMGVPSLSPRYIPDGDVIAATAWQTAEWVQAYGEEKGEKVYFVHDYEHYMSADSVLRQRIARTFQTNMTVVTTSPAGRSMVEESGGRVTAEIPNGLDFSVYQKNVEIDHPIRNLIGFPARNESFKGTEDAVQALIRVKKLYPNIAVWAYGPKRVGDLPDWVTFYLRLPDRELCDMYNRTSIFITASHYEGWGLPGAEAMACGGALVSTDNGGVRAYASHGDTALLSPPKNPEALAENILLLIQNNDLRVRLADTGYKNIQQFSWEKSADQFEGLINGL